MDAVNPCDLCRGACCETLVLPATIAGYFDREWLFARGEELEDHRVVLPARCPHLTPEGRCDIYVVRPMACNAYLVGGMYCRSAVRRRRSPEKATEILEALDAYCSQG